MQLRPARRDDAEAIRTIYNVEVETSTHVFDLVPRSLAEQQQWLEVRSGAHLCLVATEPGLDDDGGDTEVVLGFASFAPYKERPGYATTIEDSVYVARAHHGRGVGRALLAELVERATAHGFHAMIARIAGENDPSIALHRACGFSHVGIEHEVGRKFNTWLDVVVMERLLT